jgi:hypothetical protein
VTAVPPALDDFHPPYHLGAFGCALVGVWDGAPALASEDLGGFEPVRWRGGYVGAAFVLRYDRPPADYPVAYNEVILAYVVRRSLRWAAMPFDLVLDNEFYVDAGRLHYHLPKRLDPTLQIDVERDAAGVPRRITASGNDVAFDAVLGSVTVPCAKGLVSALLRGFTNHVPIIGTASQPLLSTTIGVSPDSATAYSARDAHLAAGGRTLRPLGALFWGTLAITVGVPGPIAG